MDAIEWPEGELPSQEYRSVFEEEGDEMPRLEDLDLEDEPLPDLGWTSYFELESQIDRWLGLDLDDDPAFARFCNVLRRDNL